LERHCPLVPVTEAVMANLSDTVQPQGIVLLAARPTHRLEEVLDRRDPLIVCLDAVQDPGNVGAILRTAEAAGAAGAFLLKGSAEPFAPKTLRSSMGSAFRLPIVAGVEIGDLLRAVETKQILVATTTPDGDSIYSDYDWRRPTMAVFGNEAKGVGRELMERADVRLRIPLCEPVESLNVAAAASVVLFESARQRRARI
jgi:TrmH family RNA methyltransferase